MKPTKELIWRLIRAFHNAQTSEDRSVQRDLLDIELDAALAEPEERPLVVDGKIVEPARAILRRWAEAENIEAWERELAEYPETSTDPLGIAFGVIFGCAYGYMNKGQRPSAEAAVLLDRYARGDNQP